VVLQQLSCRSAEFAGTLLLLLVVVVVLVLLV
jgi:hypothetical protein